MTQEEAAELRHGLYLVRWKGDGGASLASVGSDAGGRRWYAPTNWITVPGFNWALVESVSLMASLSPAHGAASQEMKVKL